MILSSLAKLQAHPTMYKPQYSLAITRITTRKFLFSHSTRNSSIETGTTTKIKHS
jgi:hypothetical protein